MTKRVLGGRILPPDIDPGIGKIMDEGGDKSHSYTAYIFFRKSKVCREGDGSGGKDLFVLLWPPPPNLHRFAFPVEESYTDQKDSPRQIFQIQ